MRSFLSGLAVAFGAMLLVASTALGVLLLIPAALLGICVGPKNPKGWASSKIASTKQSVNSFLDEDFR